MITTGFALRIIARGKQAYHISEEKMYTHIYMHVHTYIYT